jgi:hypothetical protein
MAAVSLVTTSLSVPVLCLGAVAFDTRIFMVNPPLFPAIPISRFQTGDTID